MITKTLLLSIALIFIPHLVFGNGAVWNEGFHGGVPGPIKQLELYLEREHVLINDRVVAIFWVKNPTTKDITTAMGFPLIGKMDSWAAENETIPENVPVTVTVNDKSVTHSVNTKNKKYPLVPCNI